MTSQPIDPRADLDRIRRAGRLRAAVSLGIPGLSQRDGDGRWTGIDADFARAVAAAIVDDPEAVEWIPVSPEDRIPAVASGSADIGACNASWTLTREERVMFAGVLCHDGEGFLVHSDLGVTDAVGLANRRVVIQGGSTSRDNIKRWQQRGGPHLELVEAATPESALETYLNRDADGYVLDRTALAGIQAGLDRPSQHRLLDDTISDEPLAPFVSSHSPGLLVVMRWCLNLLITAEAAPFRDNSWTPSEADPLGPRIGLSEGWASRVLGAAGHYGELYDRNLGRRSPLGISRGPNELWFNGGSHYAPIPR